MSALAIDFTQPFEDAFGKLLGFIPNLLGGIVILVIGYFVAKVLGKLVGKLLGKVGFDQWMERAGVSGVLQRSGTGLTASAMLGKVVFWFVFLISFTMFASALGVPEISDVHERHARLHPADLRRDRDHLPGRAVRELPGRDHPRCHRQRDARQGRQVRRSWCTPPSPR